MINLKIWKLQILISNMKIKNKVGSLFVYILFINKFVFIFIAWLFVTCVGIL